MALMQTWAWVSMLNDRIPEQGIEQAIDSTFSGEHPCEKCIAIAELEAKKAEQDSSPQGPSSDVERVAKLIGVLPVIRPVKVFPRVCSRTPFWAAHLREPNDFIPAVPCPPPRFV